MPTRVLILLLSVQLLAPSIATAANALRMKCSCVLGSSLCSNRILNQVSGSELLTWYQDIVPRMDGTAPDQRAMALACWKKRDQNPGGEGNCCFLNSDESDAPRYFKGNIE